MQYVSKLWRAAKDTGEALHLLRGPPAARIATTFMRNYKGRELTAAENIGYKIGACEYNPENCRMDAYF